MKDVPELGTSHCKGFVEDGLYLVGVGVWDTVTSIETDVFVELDSDIVGCKTLENPPYIYDYASFSSSMTCYQP